MFIVTFLHKKRKSLHKIIKNCYVMFDNFHVIIHDALAFF